jgi:hypothetical protein
MGMVGPKEQKTKESTFGVGDFLSLTDKDEDIA